MKNLRLIMQKLLQLLFGIFDLQITHEVGHQQIGDEADPKGPHVIP